MTVQEISPPAFSSGTIEGRRATEPLYDPPRAGHRTRGRIVRFFRGRPSDPAWVRPALLALLAATAVMYMWDLGASGWANSFYSAAVQAGTRSWKAFFFGSSDASNFITVDKPPASLWVMELSARLFGLNAWSILVPQAFEGVATVGLLYATVRRWFSPAAALIAGSVIALTPVAALMFRYNNPDALLVLLLTASAYATVRAIERSSPRWLVLAGALVGFGFITKMLQAFLVVPALAIAYLLFAETSVRRRVLHLGYAAVALFVSAGWWVAAVQLTPAADRPYVGGSQNNSELGLIFGYNGFGRITGNETGSVIGGGAASATTNPWGPTGITRLFNDSFGGDISWLIPGALVLLVGVLWLTRRAPRTDRTRAALVIFGGWMLATAVVFSFAKGIIHPYYTVALAPEIGGVIGIGCVAAWKRRDTMNARALLAVATTITVGWSFALLDRTPSWLPWLRFVVLTFGLVAAALIALGGNRRLNGSKAVAAAAVVAALASVAAGPLAYTIDTVATPHSGAIPTAGPTVAGAFGSPGAGGGAAAGGTGTPGGPPGLSSGGQRRAGAGPGAGGGPASGTGRAIRAAGSPGAAGFLGSSTPGEQVVKLLEEGSGSCTWVAATVGSDSAAGYQLATNDPVMAIGGFNGTDPAPTLSEFEHFVREGKIHWFIATTGAGSGGTASDAAAITAWVEANYTAKTVDGVTLYDLSGR